MSHAFDERKELFLRDAHRLRVQAKDNFNGVSFRKSSRAKANRADAIGAEFSRQVAVERFHRRPRGSHAADERGAQTGWLGSVDQDHA